MTKHAFVLNDQNVIENVIVIEDDANPADFGAIRPDFTDYFDLHIGWSYANNVITDEDGNVVNKDELIADIKGQQVREEREEIFKEEVDPVAGHKLRYEELTSEKQTELANYRQALLDITEQDGFPDNVTWPTKPDWL